MATHLERSLQQGRDLLSTYENKLVTDDTVPEDLRVVDRKKEELLVSVFSRQLSTLLTCSTKLLSKCWGNCCPTHKPESVGEGMTSPSWDETSC